MDKINVPKQLPHGAVEVEVDAEDVEVMAREEAANQMAEFWDRLISEFNVAKAFQAFENAASKSEAAAGVADAHRVGIDHTGAFVAGRRLRDDAPTEQSILPVTPPRRLVATWLWMSESTEWERETISKIGARLTTRNQ